MKLKRTTRRMIAALMMSTVCVDVAQSQNAGGKLDNPLGGSSNTPSSNFIFQPSKKPITAQATLVGKSGFQIDDASASDRSPSDQKLLLEPSVKKPTDAQRPIGSEKSIDPSNEQIAPGTHGQSQPNGADPSSDRLPRIKLLPPGELVVPLPVIPADPEFKGYPGYQPPNDGFELIPNPNKPPAYEWPKRLPPSSSGQSPLGIPSPADNSVPNMPWTVLTPDAQQQIDALFHPQPTRMSAGVCPVPLAGNEFLESPLTFCPPDPQQELATYYGKSFVPTQRPWVEWWRPFYGNGQYPPAIPLASSVNPLMPQFLIYGDYRTGVGVHRNNGAAVRSWAHRLNLDMDLKLTGTERIHAFTGPLDKNGQFTRLDFSQSPIQVQDELEARFDTGFFEGDLGAITGGLAGVDAPFDLPFTFGLVPLLYQNGIWMEDAIAGLAFGFPWRHSKLLNWANYDATFFAGFDQITSPAFNDDNGAATVMGTAWFVEAYNGYVEADYAYLSDDQNLGRAYHNTALAYTRRYFGRISNSVRLILNLGQSGPRVDRTADGGLLLIENSWITGAPSTIVPYANFFYGYGRPQSVARANGSGGILRNTGINFESDGLTGYPTLDATGSNAYGGAVGLNLLSADFTRQVALEFAGLGTYGDPIISRAPGNQYGFGTRLQRALSNSTLIRADFMVGWLDQAPDIYGSRFEYRWKF